MRITAETFEALLQCPTKAYSIYHGVPAEVRAITQLVKDYREALHRNISERLRATVPSDQLYVGTPLIEALRQRHYSMVLDCTIKTSSIQAQIHGAHLEIGEDVDGNNCVPFRFRSGERTSNTDKLLLAFDALAFSQVAGITPRFGELIAGWVEQMTSCAPSVAQALLPFPQYCGPLQGLNENAGNSTYHSLQLKAEHRFSNGLFFLASYTRSKLMTDADNNQPDNTTGGLGGTISPFQRRRNKGLALEDIPNAFSFAASYDLPLGRNKRWLNNSRLLDLAVGSWTVSSILRVYSGTPFYFRSGNCNVPGQFDVNCLPGVLSGADPFAQSKSHFDVTKPLFDIGAFEPADSFNYYFGSGSRITNLRGFGYRNQDLMLSKAFALTEHVSLQIRAEAFNLWNYHVFRDFDRDIASPSFGLWNGSVTAPRNVQLGARLQF